MYSAYNCLRCVRAYSRLRQVNQHIDGAHSGTDTLFATTWTVYTINGRQVHVFSPHVFLCVCIAIFRRHRNIYPIHRQAWTVIVKRSTFFYACGSSVVFFDVFDICNENSMRIGGLSSILLVTFDCLKLNEGLCTRMISHLSCSFL